jgi:hypothetical protein
MKAYSRRTFVVQTLFGWCVLVAPGARADDAEAEAAERANDPKVSETDPYPKSMGFRLDTHNVDDVKYPRHHADEQQCSKCQLFSAYPGEPYGHCSFFKRKVPETGWCRNFKLRQDA